jgi:hypothetical protein
MNNWWSRQAQRDRDIAAGADADLVRDNQKRFRLSYVLIGTAAALALINQLLHLVGRIADICFGLSIALMVAGFLSFKWAQAESRFLHRPDPKEPRKLFK